MSQRKGYLRLIGKESLNSFHHQSLVARRLQHFNVEVITEVEFNPKTLLQMAGLVFYYNTGHYHYANITANYDGSKQYLSIVTADNYSMEFQEELVEVTAAKKIHFMGKLSGAQLQFLYALDQGNHFHQLGKPLDASILSDDYVQQGEFTTDQHSQDVSWVCVVKIWLPKTRPQTLNHFVIELSIEINIHEKNTFSTVTFPFIRLCFR